MGSAGNNNPKPGGKMKTKKIIVLAKAKKTEQVANTMACCKTGPIAVNSET
ncbi:MAG: hypothetical protein HY789_15645 [Deltaproteobacteria bacterium]|nr:hypothetical protein [Deltaproteobacteria bacterium]